MTSWKLHHRVLLLVNLTLSIYSGISQDHLYLGGEGGKKESRPDSQVRELFPYPFSLLECVGTSITDTTELSDIVMFCLFCCHGDWAKVIPSLRWLWDDDGMSKGKSLY